MRILTRTFGFALLCVFIASSLLAQTTGKIAKFTSSTTVGDSVMFENAGLIGVNSTAPLDFMHVRFTNTNGGLTGFAVQNLGATSTSYSGMLFYDQNGALGQFQGFNNVTHEYRINNIASGGSINFMLASTSMFQVNSSGITVGSGPIRLNRSSNSELYPSGDFNTGVAWVDSGGTWQAHLFRWGAVDNNLYVSNDGVSDLVGVYLTVGGTSWTSTSDERLKTDVVPLTGILDKIKKIRVVAFDMASMSADPSTGKPIVNRDVPKRTMNDGTVIRQQIGTIAQDWVADFPELVVEPKRDDQYYGLNYERIGVVALGGVKELSNLVAEKEAEIQAQRGEIQALSARLAALEQRLAAQSAHKE